MAFNGEFEYDGKKPEPQRQCLRSRIGEVIFPQCCSEQLTPLKFEKLLDSALYWESKPMLSSKTVSLALSQTLNRCC